MMKTKLLLNCFIILFLTACATDTAQQSARKINEECGWEMQAGRTAIRIRDSNKPPSTLKARLKPLSKHSSRLLVVMHEIADEVYTFKDLNETTYSVYRFELCMRQLQKKNYPASITPQHEDLLACQQQYGNKSSPEHTQCVTKTVEQHSINSGVGNANLN